MRSCFEDLDCFEDLVDFVDIGGFGKCESKHRVKGESLRGGDGDDEFGWVLLCVHAPLLSLSVSLPLLLFSLEREREIRMFWSLGVALLLHYIPPCHGI